MIRLLKKIFGLNDMFIPYTRLPARPVITAALKQFEERNHGLDN